MGKISKIIIFLLMGLTLLFVVGEKTKLYVETRFPYVGLGSLEKGYVSVGQYSYKGKNGVDALTLLKDFTHVEQDSSGMVSAIGNVKADSKKHEYWAFYVNGKLAQIGPADFKTKDSDLIVWKIEKY